MIEIKCDQFGNVKIDVKDMVGVSCKEATRQLEAAFVGKKKDEEKPEYFDSETTQVSDLNKLRM